MDKLSWLFLVALVGCGTLGSGDTPCIHDEQCETQYCAGADPAKMIKGTCQRAPCDDKVRNGDESDVDCGGVFCFSKCGLGKLCRVDKNCFDNRCVQGVCQGPPPPSCNNKIGDGDETDVDCGGKQCPACPDGKGCVVDSDCQSGYCKQGVVLTYNTCQNSCPDGMKNGDESDVDCGGKHCLACPERKACRENADCQSKICKSGACAKNTCSDGVKNGDESDVDCGSRCPQQCANGKRCDSHADCESKRCLFDGGMPDGGKPVGICITAGTDGGILDAAPDRG